jgi:hypothetical protein
VAGIGAALVSGCAIHPLPEQVTGGINTFEIVLAIRCEARHAIKEQAQALLLNDKKADADVKKKWADFLEHNVKEWRQIPLERFSPTTRELIARYDGAEIAHDFTFTISEDNKLSTDIGLKALGTGFNFLSIKAGNDRSRENQRVFRVKDTFDSILEDKHLRCSNVSRAPNYVYPITGRIGTAEVIATFLNLNELQKLTQKGADAALFADTLKFTTIWQGSINPKVTLAPGNRSLELDSAAFTAEAKRSDVHQVIVGLYLPKDGDPAKAPSKPARPASDRPTATDPSPLDRFLDKQLDRQALESFGSGRSLLRSILP